MKTFLAWAGGIVLGLFLFVLVVIPFGAFVVRVASCAIGSASTQQKEKVVEKAKLPVPATTPAPAEEIMEECCGTDPLVAQVVAGQQRLTEKSVDALVAVTGKLVDKLPGPAPTAPAVQVVAPRQPAPPCPDCSGRVYHYRGRRRIN